MKLLKLEKVQTIWTIKTNTFTTIFNLYLIDSRQGLELNHSLLIMTALWHTDISVETQTDYQQCRYSLVWQVHIALSWWPQFSNLQLLCKTKQITSASSSLENLIFNWLDFTYGCFLIRTIRENCKDCG